MLPNLRKKATVKEERNQLFTAEKSRPTLSEQLRATEKCEIGYDKRAKPAGGGLRGKH